MLDKIKQSHWLTWPTIIAPLAVLALLIGGAVVGYRDYKNKSSKSAVNSEVSAKRVKVAELGQYGNGEQLIAEGTVKAASRVDIVALANGTVKTINFKAGDRVSANQPLIYLYDDIALTNLTNAGNNLGNLQQNFSNTSGLIGDSLKQAELGLVRAREAVASAEIGLQSARDNLSNTANLQEKSKQDAKNSAVINYYNYLSEVNSALSQVNYIIKAEGSSQLDGISPTLGVLDSSSLTIAKADYLLARDNYDVLFKEAPTPETAIEAIRKIIVNLNQARVVVEDTVIVLEDTIASDTFSESALNAQRASFAGLRASVISTQNTAQTNLAALENLDLVNKQLLDGLTNGVRSAESQLNQAKISYDNAVVALANAKKGGDQQLTLSRTSLDGARGQYNLIASQVSDLTVKSPISGQVGGRLVDIGSEVRIGQKLAEVSQTDSVKIILGLAIEDAARIKLGGKVIINDGLAGSVNQIDPAADSSSKKVKVEIVFENSKKELIAETLATVKIPLAGGVRFGGNYLLPLSAITVGQNENYFFTAEGDRAKKISIELIEVEGESATVKVDLPKEALVIIEGNKLLEDGDMLVIEI